MKLVLNMIDHNNIKNIYYTTLIGSIQSSGTAPGLPNVRPAYADWAYMTECAPRRRGIIVFGFGTESLKRSYSSGTKSPAP